MDAAFATEQAGLESSATEGLLVDGHGDLRPEHVCFETRVAIFDCLEFSEVLRQVDPVDELAALHVECTLLGAEGFGRSLLERVCGAIGWPTRDRLFSLHSARRALLRARLALAHLLDAAPRQPEKWEPLATRYLEIAERALDELSES
jgi:aminoglycoside phosphotransferase family enzyme